MKSVTWIKMLAAGGVMCIGGPALIYYVMPSEEELFMRYNPELQRRSLETRQERKEDYEKFLRRLQEHSKSDRNIWIEWQKNGERERRSAIEREIEERRNVEEQAAAKRAEIKNSIR